MTHARASKRIIICAFGSFGDVHPYIPIALELKARGHEPVIATLPYYREKIEALGLGFHPVRPDLSPMEASPELMERTMDARTGPAVVIKELVIAHLRDTYEDTLQAARGADLIVSHPITFAAPIVAQQLGIAWVSSVLAPASFFSAYDPMVPPPAPWVEKLLRFSPLLARGFNSIARRMTRSWVEPVERLRAELGLPAGGHPVFAGQHSPALVLALFSTVLAAPQRDWPPHVRVTGFPFYDRRDENTDGGGLAPELQEFLAAGEPPLVFTLGSAAVWVAGDFYQESIAAARTLGRRAVLLIGDERNRPRAPLPAGIVAFDYAPFGELLPRAAATAHQGGIGTTAQALRAGRPMLVVPFSHDQPDNAARVTRLGVARTLARHRYKAARVARELRELLENPSYAQRAAAVGARVRSENGARAAADAIEEKMSDE